VVWRGVEWVASPPSLALCVHALRAPTPCPCAPNTAQIMWYQAADWVSQDPDVSDRMENERHLRVRV
jgi:hypothetical protein